LTERTERHVVVGLGADEVGPEVGGLGGSAGADAEAEPCGSGALVVVRADGEALLPPGADVPVAEGVPYEIRPGPLGDPAAAGSGEGDGASACCSVTTIAVTQAATVAIARAPASHRRRVPGTRVVSGDQPLSHGSF
jgi:hypothetical protein